MAKTNTEILTQINATASAEYQNRMTDPTTGEVLTGERAYRALTDYPTAKNEFINTLTNKIVKSYFYSKVFSNPLKMLHRGELPFGTSLEQLFVGMSTKKNFGENFGTTNTAVESLIGTEKSDVKAMYISKNFAYKYKVSLSEVMLRGAFMSQTGLSELVGQLTNSAISACYYDEFTDMKTVITNAIKSGKDFKNETLSATGITIQAPKTVVVGQDPRSWAENIRALTGRLRFPSTAYNMTGVKTWSNPEDLILITTPEHVAKIDVNVLALAFNTSMTDVKIKVIEVDELPDKVCTTIGTEGTAAKKVVGIIMDKDWLQCYDTVMTTRQFENGDDLVTNQFLHKQGVMASCLFANIVTLIEA